MPDVHAFLSPSSAPRWVNCPPSAALAAQFPDTGSTYAQEGTEAHRLCEFLLKTALGRKDIDPRAQLEYYDADMEENCAGYVQFVMEKVAAFRKEGVEPVVRVEQRVSLESLIPHCFGTSDCLLIAGDVITVIDFKYGMVPVAASSLQLRLYAIGACELFSSLYDFTKVRTVIYQPRIPHVDEAEMDIRELYDWAREELVPKAKLAAAGEGKYRAGEWCRFCPARTQCRTLAELQLGVARYEFRDPQLLTEEELSDVLGRAGELVSWAEAVKDYALATALKGRRIPGWKIVESRANRRFTDDAEAARRVREETDKDPYETRVLSVSAMEKMLGKKRFAELLSDLTVRPAGKPALVPEADKRPEMGIAGMEFRGEG